MTEKYRLTTTLDRVILVELNLRTLEDIKVGVNTLLHEQNGVLAKLVNRGDQSEYRYNVAKSVERLTTLRLKIQRVIESELEKPQ